MLISKKWLCKLADFGMAKQYTMNVDADVSATALGTPHYMAPETFLREGYSEKADVWSLGCILYELLTFMRPFEAAAGNNGAAAVAQRILDEPHTPVAERRSNPSRAMVELVDSLLHKDPLQRPSAKQILQLPLTQPLLDEFIRRFERSASSHIDKVWAEVLHDHRQLLAVDALSSPRSRIGNNVLRRAVIDLRASLKHAPLGAQTCSPKKKTPPGEKSHATKQA